MTSTLETAARIIANRVPGPFREAGGLPGERAAMRLDAAARAYLWNRNVRHMGARAALEAAAPVALRPHTDRRARLWYGNRGGAGAPFPRGRDLLRWIENTEAAGLRFVAWADELASLRHTGWYTNDDGDGDSLRGGVWQLPGKGTRARLLYGYAEFEGRGEMNPGSAALVVSEIVETESCTAWEGVRDLPETRDAAQWADGLAERMAEQERDYRRAYDKGREAAEADGEAIEARRELLPLLAELRAERKRARRPWEGEAMRPAICAALRSRVDSLLETISDKREARESSWGDAWGDSLEPWRAGFMDNAADGFRRAVRLGYASRDDWKGPPEANPMGALA